jgi:hypothetical protein
MYLSDAGNTTITITGTRFSPSMKVEIPAGLGTLVSKVITHPTSTTSKCVIVVNVATPGASTNYDITLSNGGESSSDSKISINLADFSPSDLIVGPNDFWWDPNTLSSTYSDGDYAPSFPSSGGNFTLTQTTGHTQQKYIHNHTWSSGKVASGVGWEPRTAYSRTISYQNVIPLSSSSGNIENLTIAFVIKNVSSDSYGNNFVPNFYIGNYYAPPYALIQYRPGHSSYGWRASGAGGYNGGGAYGTGFDVENTIRTVFYTISGSTNGRLVIPGAGIDSTGTMTALPIPTAVWDVYKASRIPVIFGEMFILNYAITDTERHLIQTYWAAKYGA